MGIPMVGAFPIGRCSYDLAGDGGFVCVATVGSDDGGVSGTPEGCAIWMIKRDDLGSVEWEFKVGKSASDDAYFVRVGTPMIAVQQVVAE